MKVWWVKDGDKADGRRVMDMKRENRETREKQDSRRQTKRRTSLNIEETE